MKAKRTLAAIFLISVIFLIVSCARQEEPPQQVHLAWEKITDQVSGKSDYSYEDVPRLKVITSPSNVQSLSGQVYPEVLEQVQSVDFSKFFVIAVFQGQQDTTGYFVEVTNVELREGTVFVYANFNEPSPGDVVGETLTSPYYILKVRKTEGVTGSLTFVLIANGEEVIRQTYVIP